MTRRPATEPRQLTFAVLGDPVPQGSMRWLGGRGMIAANKASLEPWREAIRTAAHQAMPEGWTPMEGPLLADLAFAMRTPKTLPRWRLLPDSRPDLDKLVRAALDALTSIGAWLDDAQVVAITARKVWAAPGNLVTREAIPGLRVHLRTIDPQLFAFAFVEQDRSHSASRVHNVGVTRPVADGVSADQ